MIGKILSFFSAIVIFFQMLIGGFPMFGRETSEIIGFGVTGILAQDGLTYTVNNPVDTKFNRFSLSYDSDSYLRGVIFYTYKCEEFYMEPGNNMTYASYIDTYLDYGCGKHISKITFDVIDGAGINFILKSITTSVEDVYQDVIYIENSRYKLGASLLWGGAISYLEDCTDGDGNLTNLVNCHDTGRLIQQSYYGTTSAPYEPGESFNATWPYNPVQGGNQYNQNSKIIDVRVDGDTIYIKGRAREWAKPEFTYCYMENTYTLYDNYVKVDNRFVDYSPYTHPLTSQECPAFYTVSYLGTFVYYDGAAQWTDDTLTYRDDLGFWGDPNEPQVRKSFNSGDDETWSAWVHDDWGIGLYTPDIKYICAGRSDYSGTKDALAGPTNYTAPVGQFQIIRCKPMAYSYFVASGTTTEMRGLFKSLKGTLSNDILK